MTEAQTPVPAERQAVPPVAETLDVVKEWADRLAGLPLTVLARGDVGPVVSGRMWVDGTFELVDLWWAAQRRSVDQLLAAQHRAATQVLASGWALAELNRSLVRRPAPAPR